MTPEQMKMLAYQLEELDLAPCDEAADLIRQMAQREVNEQGPWKAELWKAEQVVVASDDFEHDARLLVLGDFSDEGQRMQYAQEIARRLNMAQQVPLTNEQIASACYSHRHDFGLLSTAAQQAIMNEAREWARCFGIRSDK